MGRFGFHSRSVGRQDFRLLDFGRRDDFSRFDGLGLFRIDSLNKWLDQLKIRINSPLHPHFRTYLFLKRVDRPMGLPIVVRNISIEIHLGDG